MMRETQIINENNSVSPLEDNFSTIRHKTVLLVREGIIHGQN